MSIDNGVCRLQEEYDRDIASFPKKRKVDVMKFVPCLFLCLSLIPGFFSVTYARSSEGSCVGKTARENIYCVGQGFDQDQCENAINQEHCTWVE